MRKVMYFQGGIVAEFTVPDALFHAFSREMDWDRRYNDDELQKAQRVLGNFVTASDEGTPQGANESAAACFVWNFFNTNPDADRVIDDDIFIVDLAGDGETIEYAAVRDIPLTPDH